MVRITDDLQSVVNDFDIIIDFTVPSRRWPICSWRSSTASASSSALLVLMKPAKRAIRQASEQMGIVSASNYSVGVNLVFKLLEQLPR